MRRLIGTLLALALALPVSAKAETALWLSADRLAAGGLLEIRVTGAPAAEYRYEVLRDGERLFQGDFCAQASGFYRPRAAGEYTLRVTARLEDGREEGAQARFQVTEPPVCRVTCPKESVRTGEPLDFSVDVQGGAGDEAYAYSLYRGAERIDFQQSGEPRFSFTPFEAGEYTLRVSVQDAQGGAAAGEASVRVVPGDSLSVSGDRGAFYAQGGIRTWIVRALGVWTARAEGGFITLDRDCGKSGEGLTVSVAACPEGPREGRVILTQGENQVEIPVFQARGSGREEEIFLSAPADFIAIEGTTGLSWPGAAGERFFPVSASGDWAAACDAPYVALEKGMDGLTLYAEENPGNTARDCAVTLTCGDAQAYLYLFQPPAAGAEVLSLSLTGEAGRAYQDAATARVLTTADAAALFVWADGWKAPLVFPAESAAAGAEGLLWTVEIPLTGAGEQTLLFTAESEAGAGRGAVAAVSVEGEGPGVAGAAAGLTISDSAAVLTVQTTAATRQIETLDAAGQLIRAYTREQAEIDRCVDGDETGRYAQWRLTLEAGETPAAVRAGGETLPVALSGAAEGRLSPYSQNDGWWQGKKYRHSDLEQSGCAIFALSHALQWLGYTGDEILPERLAEAYAFCLLEGGTMNSTLIGHAGDDLGFRTRYDLYTSLGEIRRKLEAGAVFSFAVVSGHIAMAAELSEDGTKFRILDSAPSATWERIQGARLYFLTERGEWAAADALSDIPGSRYYIETNAYGGLEYWLDADYVARRGVRLIQP